MRNLEHLRAVRFTKVMDTLADDRHGQQAAAWIGKEKLHDALNLRARINGSVPCERDEHGRGVYFEDPTATCWRSSPGPTAAAADPPARSTPVSVAVTPPAAGRPICGTSANLGHDEPGTTPYAEHMQPSYDVTITCPWHWGIAIVSAPGAAVPETLDDSLVTVTAETLVIKVRHAQDIDGEVFEGWDWATVTIRVRHVRDFGDNLEPVIYEGVLRLPDGQLAIGDADSEVTVNDLDGITRVRVRALDQATSGAGALCIDLAPQIE